MGYPIWIKQAIQHLKICEIKLQTITPQDALFLA